MNCGTLSEAPLDESTLRMSSTSDNLVQLRYCLNPLSTMEATDDVQTVYSSARAACNSDEKCHYLVQDDKKFTLCKTVTGRLKNGDGLPTIAKTNNNCAWGEWITSNGASGFGASASPQCTAGSAVGIECRYAGSKKTFASHADGTLEYVCELTPDAMAACYNNGTSQSCSNVQARLLCKSGS